MESDPTVTFSINLKIQNQDFTLTQTEAYSIYNQLHKILGIAEPKIWPDFRYSYPSYTYPSYPTVFYTIGSSSDTNVSWKTC